MITGFFLNIFYGLVSFFIGLLPTVAMPVGFVSAVSLFWGYLNSFSAFFPVTTLIAVLSFAVTFHLILLGYDLSLKIYHMIRGR